MMNCQVFKKKYCLFIACLLFICMGIGSFYDYQISSKLYDSQNLFGIFFASYGQLPAMLCLSVSGTLLLRMKDNTTSFKKVLCYIFAVLLNALSIMAVAIDPLLYIKNMSPLVSVMIAIIIVGGIDVWVYRVTQQTPLHQIKKFIILLLGVMFVELIVINVIKISWGRPRMRFISEYSVDLFQPWWVIGSQAKEHFMALGIASEEFKSFPSGHTANAACAMLLGCLPLMITKLKGKEDILFWLGALFTFIVAFSRIVAGAHFLTDVTIGMAVTFIIEIIIIRYLWKKEL